MTIPYGDYRLAATETRLKYECCKSEFSTTLRIWKRLRWCVILSERINAVTSK